MKLQKKQIHVIKFVIKLDSVVINAKIYAILIRIAQFLLVKQKLLLNVNVKIDKL